MISLHSSSSLVCVYGVPGAVRFVFSVATCYIFLNCEPDTQYFVVASLFLPSYPTCLLPPPPPL